MGTLKCEFVQTAKGVQEDSVLRFVLFTFHVNDTVSSVTESNTHIPDDEIISYCQQSMGRLLNRFSPSFPI